MSRVPRDSNLITALATTSSNSKRQTHPLVRQDLHKDYERKYSVEKMLVVSLEGLGAKMN
jgi:hypothetical protein